MQPQKEKKLKGKTLLQSLLTNKIIEFEMTIPGYYQMFDILATTEQKLYISAHGDFLGSAKDIKKAIELISLAEQKPVEIYDLSKIEVKYVLEEEEIETKIREEVLPKKLTTKNGIKMHGKQFYIVKKKPDGSSSGKAYCLYNFKTRNLIWAHWDREVLVGFLATRYKSIENKDI